MNKSTLTPYPYFYKFPDPQQADEEGLVAVGGTLNVDILYSAYIQGIFPWYTDESPILWWSPDPRMVLFPNNFYPGKNLLRKVKKKIFTIKCDTCFEKVIKACATVKRKDQNGTWITKDMIKAYIEFHNEGFAHSFEVFLNNQLVGGLYGVSIGKAFFGESMFHYITDTSKIALHYLVEFSKKVDFLFIDAQQSTQHLKNLGAKDISRNEFLKLLDKAIKYETLRGKWTKIFNEFFNQ